MREADRQKWLRRPVFFFQARSFNAALTLALMEFIARREQRKLTELFGKFDGDARFDYKAERSRS